MRIITLIPNRGRDYGDAHAVRTDLDAGRDFIVFDLTSPWNGKPCNIDDLRRINVGVVRVRYSALREVCHIPLPCPVHDAPHRRACDTSF